MTLSTDTKTSDAPSRITTLPWERLRRLSPFPVRFARDKGFSPDFDLRETADGLVLRADLPGVPRDQVEIGILGRTLTVSGTRAAAAGQDTDVYLAREVRSGAFRREFTLPAWARDHLDAEAELVLGVLTLTLHKRPSTGVPTLVEIQTPEAPRSLIATFLGAAQGKLGGRPRRAPWGTRATSEKGTTRTNGLGGRRPSSSAGVPG